MSIGGALPDFTRFETTTMNIIIQFFFGHVWIRNCRWIGHLELAPEARNITSGRIAKSAYEGRFFPHPSPKLYSGAADNPDERRVLAP